MSEVAEALYQWGREDSKAEIARKDAAIAKMKSDNAEKDSALMEQQAEIERLRAEIRRLTQAQGQ